MIRVQMNNFFNSMSAINRYSASDLSIRLNSPPPCHFRVIDAVLVSKISTVKKDTPEVNIAGSVINENVYLNYTLLGSNSNCKNRTKNIMVHTNTPTVCIRNLGLILLKEVSWLFLGHIKANNIIWGSSVSRFNPKTIHGQVKLAYIPETRCIYIF